MSNNRADTDLIHSVFLRDLESLRQVERLVRSHPGISDYATIDEDGMPRGVWVRQGAEWVQERL